MRLASLLWPRTCAERAQAVLMFKVRVWHMAGFSSVLSRLFLVSKVPVASCLYAQAAIELIAFLLPPLACLHDALTSGDAFLAVLRYLVELRANKYVRKQLLNL